MLVCAGLYYDLGVLIGVLIGAVIWTLPALLVARLAKRKGRSFLGYLLASMFMFWPFVLMVVLVLPRRRRVM